jgi:hypothetical protein
MTSAPERFALLPVSRPIFPEIALLLKANVYGMRIVRPSQNAKNFQREVTVLTYQNPKERRTPHTSLKQICTLPVRHLQLCSKHIFQYLESACGTTTKRHSALRRRHLSSPLRRHYNSHHHPVAINQAGCGQYQLRYPFFPF